MVVKKGLSVYKPHGTTMTSAMRVKIAREKEKAIQIQQLRAMDRFAAKVYGGDEKYCDMGIGTSGTANVTASASGAVVTFYNISDAFGPGSGGTNPAATLVGIPQGTTKNTRIGNKIRLTKIRGHCTVIMPSANAGDVIRIILYKDNQANGATVTVANVLENAATEGFESFQAMDYVDRIKIIKDITVEVNPQIGTSSTSSTPFYKVVKFSHKPNCEIRYSSTTGALTEVQSDNYGMIVIGLNGAVTMSGTFRVYYFDK